MCPEGKGDVVITAYSKGKWGSGYCVLERKMVVVVIAYSKGKWGSDYCVLERKMVVVVIAYRFLAIEISI